jgi:hypothetical protein
MASTYVNDLRLNEMATGDASGSWGTVTNTNLELIGEAFSYGTETIGDADSTLTIADGAADAARSFYLKITSSVDLTTTRIVTLGPNTVSKVWMIENATTGSQVITIKQGSGATINVPNGQVKMISTDGAGSGGAVLDLLVDVDLTGTTTLVNLNVSGAVDIAGDLTLSAGGDGALRFTAASSVKVLDNNAAALVFEEADNAYMTFVTTDGSEAVKFDKALDINAATQIDATVTVGVDDTGYDVKFFGATAGAYMLWDESADDLILGGAAGLSVNSTALVTGVLTTTAATVSNGGGQFNGAINVGVDDTGYDVKFFGATAGKYMLWDESADTLEVSGTVVAGAGTALLPSITTTGDLNTGMWFPAADTIAFSEGGVEALRINSSGNVGIGTSSPDAGLHIDNPSDGAITAILDTDNTAVKLVFRNNTETGNNVQIGADGSSLVALTNASEAMRIDSSQRVLIGATASRTVQGFATRLQVEGTAATDSSVQIVRNSNDVNPPYINFGKTRGSVGGVTAVADGDILGEISWGGADGGDLNNVSATIQGVAEATATNNDTPGRLVFKTTASGAGASTERMRITEHGSVGIGCTPDDLNSLDIQRTSKTSSNVFVRVKNTTLNEDSGYKVEANVSGAIATHTCGINIVYSGVDMSHLTSSGAGYRWYTNAATAAPKMSLSSAGLLSNVGGINIDFPDTPAVNALYVQAYPTSLATVFFHRDNTDAQYALSLKHDGPVDGGGTGYMALFLDRGDVTRGSITISGSSTVYATSSDYRLKEDWQLMSGASDRVLALKPVNFAWIESGNRVDGFLAHELADVVPEAVIGTKDAMRDEEYEVTAAVEATYDEDGNELTAAVEAVMGTRSVPDYQGIDQSKLVPLLTAALQEALTEISALKARVTALEG